MLSVVENIGYVNPVEAEELQELFAADDVHCICQRLVIRTLFASGFKVKSREKNKKVDDIQYVFDTYFDPVMREALTHMFTYGYVVWAVVERKDKHFKDSPVYVPQVVPRNLYKIGRKIDDNLRVEWLVETITSPLVKGPELFLFFMPSHQPDIDTLKHRSIIAPSARHSDFINQLYEGFVVAHKQRSQPPILLQHTKAASSHESIMSSVEQSMTDMYEVSNAKAKMNQVNAVKAVNKSKDDFIQNSGSQTLVTDTSLAKRIKYSPSIVSSRFIIPEGLEVASAQGHMPEAQPDFFTHLSEHKNQSLHEWGIPPSMVASAAGKSSSATVLIDDNDYLAFGATMKTYRNAAILCARAMYLSACPHLNDECDIKIDLPLTPFLSTTKIQDLIDRNTISTEAGRKYIALIAGLDEEDLLEEGKQNEHLRAPVGGNEMQTTALMKAKEAAIWADVHKVNAETKVLKSGGEEGKDDAKLMDKEKELTELEINGKLEVMEMQITLLKEQVKADKQKLAEQRKTSKQKASDQVRVSKAAKSAAAKSKAPS